MCCKNINSRYSQEELDGIAQRAREWANSLEGISIMKEAKERFNDYVAIRKKERGEKPPINIYEPFMRAI